MTASGYKYQGQPIEELSRADLLAALIETNEHIEDLMEEIDALKAAKGES